jgi:hypothetical protein
MQANLIAGIGLGIGVAFIFICFQTVLPILKRIYKQSFDFVAHASVEM